MRTPRAAGQMPRSLHSFLRNDHGAVTVDWTVLSAAVVGLSLATVAVLNGGIDGMISRADRELRAQQMSDSFVAFTSAHFEPLYASNLATAETAEGYFLAANQLMNQQIIDALETGIDAINAGTLTRDEALALMAVASVGYQRNIVDDQIMHYYFGFGQTTGLIENFL
jgi:Flp pilus assembly pilin Flp